jgi:dienelactone hydrolase
MTRSALQLTATILTLGAIALAGQPASAQEVVRLYPGVPPGSESWSQSEQLIATRFSEIKVVANVSEPTLTVHRPKIPTATRTGVVVMPGGAFHFLAVEPEGTAMAEWLAARGVTAFVLKYRVLQTTKEHQDRIGTEKLAENYAEQATVFPLAVADAKRALTYVRDHASDFGVDPRRIGMIGFSAGANLAVSLAVTSSDAPGPDFVASLYGPITDFMRPFAVPSTAVPIFLAAASDDQLGFALHSTEIYNAWLGQRRSAELHLYEKGGHGFGLLKRGLPVDSWTDRFADWLRFHGFLQTQQ